MANNYDPVAGYYDLLSRLVFGKAEINAQVGSLNYLHVADRILIVGGGTGWTLDKVAALHPWGLRITYVESSVKMMTLAKKRDWQKNEIRFVLLPVEQFVAEERYDSILTGFFFDNFSTKSATAILRLLDALLKSGGHWLFADFCRPGGKNKLWQAILLKSMYLSVRILLKVEAKELPDMEVLFASAGYRQLSVSFYYRRFIKSIVYQKRDKINW